jgi:carboxyl-terminal processing protease
LDFAIIRATFNVASVEDFGVIGDTGIAMIRIEQFTVPAAEEFEKILRRHVSRKMKGLIIDLRANPGGLIFSAVQITSMFLDSGVSVVTQEGPRDVQRYDALSGYKCPADIPVAILVDDVSASASELMAQCLKDYKRAVIVGRRTYGKGSVQTVHYFGDGSGIKLTVAKYFTPSRTPIHGQGVEPDVISVLEEETEKGANRPRYRKDALDQDVYVRDAVRILQNSNSKEEKP